MTLPRPVVARPQAELEIRSATVHYRNVGGEALALKWAAAVAKTLSHIADFPQTGSTRYAVSLNLAGLRVWPVNDFPYLVFYVERETQVDVWRVLHAQRDVPTWIGESG